MRLADSDASAGDCPGTKIVIPVLHFSEGLYLPTWILVLSVTMSLALLWVNTRAAKWDLSRSQALDLSVYMMLGAVVGGRLLHVFYESPAYYIRQPTAIFAIWEGGFVFYGGLLGALVIGYRWCTKHDQSAWRWGDFFAPIFALCYALGRIGCFLNGCCFGKTCDLPWAVTFPSHAAYGIEVLPRHPTQLYAAIWELAVLTVLLVVEKRRSRAGSILLLWLFLHSAGRFVMELFRADDRGPQFWGLSLGMILSLVLLTTTLWFWQIRSRRVSN